MSSHTSQLRIGIDLGGSKIAGIALGDRDETVAELRRDAPRNDYDATLAAIVDSVTALERQAGGADRIGTGTVGIGTPGSFSPKTGLMQGSNAVWLNGQPLSRDLEARLKRPVRMENDANCFALSEASDGAAAGAQTVFGVIVGTGCGGGIIRDRKPLHGPNRIGGEWGHVPLPWPEPDERPGPACWCGRRGCMETWISGSGLERDHYAVTGERLTGPEIAATALTDPCSQATLDRHVSRMARGLAMIVNIIDPDVIVLGGGLSKLDHLYARLPEAMKLHIFAADPAVDIRPPRFGDTSGVRGAARLWDRQ